MAFDLKQQARLLFGEVWTKCRLELIDELIAADYLGHDPEFGALTRESLRRLVPKFHEAFPDFHFEVDDLLCEDDRVVTSWTATGTNLGPFFGRPATGRLVAVSGITIAEFVDGKIVHDWTEWDAHGLYRQLRGEQGGEVTAPIGSQPAVEMRH
jgi:steroid delta-isomerase-like uncharacterized protein